MGMNDVERAKFLLYQEKVRKLSEKNFKKYYVDNKELRGGDYELDHKYSISEGFKNDVPESILADLCNLEVIPKEQNRRKGSRCSIELQELLDQISENDEYF
jgi:hypothetical protein